ncbi:MAG: type II toxin-antitoxin system VapC family toxin [Acidobacteria bacterium]|nr:type II toxin-antitoxin system VapC family toxin [Acidobacteriota bacterium]
MMAAVLDTHAAIWYVFIRKRLSQDALRFIRRAVDSGRPAYVSAISIVETIYLIERGRIPLEALHRLEAGLKDPTSGLLVAPVDEEVAEAIHKVPRDLVPEMPDRIIAATALHLGLPLITRDGRIASAGIKTVW